MLCGMVGHPPQRYGGNAVPRPLPYANQYREYHPTIAATVPSQHILAPYIPQDIYGHTVIPKHSPVPSPEQQASPATSSSSSAEGDHPIGYGAFGVVW